MRLISVDMMVESQEWVCLWMLCKAISIQTPSEVELKLSENSSDKSTHWEGSSPCSLNQFSGLNCFPFSFIRSEMRDPKSKHTMTSMDRSSMNPSTEAESKWILYNATYMFLLHFDNVILTNSVLNAASFQLSGSLGYALTAARYSS